MLLGWMQSREGGTETRQGFVTLAGRVCVSVLVIVGTDVCQALDSPGETSFLSSQHLSSLWLTEHRAHCSPASRLPLRSDAKAWLSLLSCWSCWGVRQPGLGQLFEFSKVQLQQDYTLLQLVGGAIRCGTGRDRQGGGVPYWALIIFTVRGDTDRLGVYLSFQQEECLFKGPQIGFIPLDHDLSFGVICDSKQSVILVKVFIFTDLCIGSDLPPEPMPSLDMYA